MGSNRNSDDDCVKKLARFTEDVRGVPVKLRVLRQYETHHLR